jgi:hypothetical protein
MPDRPPHASGRSDRRPKRPARALAVLLAIAGGAPATAAAAPAACDDVRAVEAVRAAASREHVDVSTLQLVVEGPYGRAKFVRTHPTFRAGEALKRKLAKRTFYFVWFHPSFRGQAGVRGTDLWALVDVRGCELLHLARAE